jgi:glycosyltransferase involved in cell wall biosynthesis
MRVLQLVPTYGTVGGIERYAERLMVALQARGDSVLTLANVLENPGCCAGHVEEIRGFAPVLEQDYEPQAERRLVARARDFRPDVVLSHYVRNPRLLTALGAAFPTVELVHTLLCDGAKLFRRNLAVCDRRLGAGCLVRWYTGPCGSKRSPLRAVAAYRRAARYVEALRQMRCVVVGSDFMRNYLIGEGVPADRVRVTDLAVGIAPQQPVAKRKRSGVTLLVVGRLVFNKGVDAVLHALTRLDARYELVVVGDGYYRGALERHAKALGLGARVAFKGFLLGARLEEQYRAADVVVVPSFVPEPAGLVVPEARARGLPVVVFDVGGLGEWAQAYDSIYLAAPADAQSLAAAIERAASAAVEPRATRSGSPRLSMIEVLEQAVAAPAV